MVSLALCHSEIGKHTSDSPGSMCSMASIIWSTSGTVARGCCSLEIGLRTAPILVTCVLDEGMAISLGIFSAEGLTFEGRI